MRKHAIRLALSACRYLADWVHSFRSLALLAANIYDQEMASHHEKV